MRGVGNGLPFFHLKSKFPTRMMYSSLVLITLLNPFFSSRPTKFKILLSKKASKIPLKIMGPENAKHNASHIRTSEMVITTATRNRTGVSINL
jgi:hypothetical protein